MYLFGFASFHSHSSYFEGGAVAAYIVAVTAAATAAFLLASESTPSASGRDVVVAYALAFLAPFRDAAAVVPVQVNP